MRLTKEKGGTTPEGDCLQNIERLNTLLMLCEANTFW
jgi:hypothetical protein